MPFDLRMHKVIASFTAGQQHVTAGVAQVDVGLTGFPLAPQAQAQAAAITALLQDKANVSNQHMETLKKLPRQWWVPTPVSVQKIC